MLDSIKRDDLRKIFTNFIEGQIVKTQGEIMDGNLTHIDKDGNARMVDVSPKKLTDRIAIAEGWVLLSESTKQQIVGKLFQKGDVLQVAQLAGIMGAKKTADIIPLCHPIPIDSVSVVLHTEETKGIRIVAEVQNRWRTGVEMEALTSVSCAALTIYDMIKSVERQAEITGIKLLYKNGGKSGEWKCPE